MRAKTAAPEPGTRTRVGGSGTTVLPDAFFDRMAASDGQEFHGFLEAAVRAELRADPTLLG